MPDKNEYLFPAPGSVLRGLLNLKAQLGEPFSEDDATADVMLDLDRVDRGRAPDRFGTGLPHAYSYYAKRWGWGKGTVTRAFAGDEKRGVEPWIRARSAEWRAFYAGDAESGSGTARDRSGTAPGPESGDSDESGGIGDRSGTARDRGGTGIEQTTNLQKEEEEEDNRARASAPVSLDELPAGALRFRSQIEAHVGRDELGRRQAAFRAFNAGPLPPADVQRVLDEAEARAGPVAVAAAVVITANEAAARFHPQRINHFQSTLDNLLDHVQRHRIGTDDVAPPLNGSAGGAGRVNPNDLTADHVRSVGERALEIVRAAKGE